MVPDNELLSITVLGEYFVVTKSGVNLVYLVRYYCRIFFSKFMFGCVCLVSSTEAFGIICFGYEAVLWM